LFKVGVSKDPKRRLKTLQTGNPAALELMFTVECRDVPAYAAEAIIHKHLADIRVKGEWFTIETDDFVVRLAKTMMTAIENMPATTSSASPVGCTPSMELPPNAPTSKPARAGSMRWRRPPSLGVRNDE
jgi:hypothetical protein